MYEHIYNNIGGIENLSGGLRFDISFGYMYGVMTVIAIWVAVSFIKRKLA